MRRGGGMQVRAVRPNHDQRDILTWQERRGRDIAATMAKMPLVDHLKPADAKLVTWYALIATLERYGISGLPWPF